MTKTPHSFESADQAVTPEVSASLHDNLIPFSIDTSDPYFNQQWHLNNTGQFGGQAGIDINVLPIWDDYSGDNVRVGIIDDGIDYSHEDLNPNYRFDLDWDTINNDSNAIAEMSFGDRHGTAVAGVIAADDNGSGALGVAPDADIAGLRIGFGASGTIQQINTAFDRAFDFDVVNNSWGFSSSFADNFNASWIQTARTNLMNAVEGGRGGLGTNIVFAAGNSREDGDNVNYHNLQNSPYTVTVGAVNRFGDFASYSTPGAAVLVSAPGSDIVTTDVPGQEGYTSGDFVAAFGTSFAAPVVSGVIALMLDANNNLGYRDVQEILALSARQIDDGFADWQENGAANWNGGGMHFSHQYGFGLVDATTAVYLAESWAPQSSTYSNIDNVDGQSSSTVSIPDNDGSIASSSISIASDIIIDHVEISMSITHNHIGHLDVVLVSPTGTRSILVDNPGASPSSSDDVGMGDNNINFTFSSVAHWGESSAGEWTLEITDRISGVSGRLNDWSISFIGDEGADDTYFYTDAFVDAFSVSEQEQRGFLQDTNGGTDTLNLAAMTYDARLDLSGQIQSSFADVILSDVENSGIENLTLGQGSDYVIANDAANILLGNRGNDTLWAGAQNDIVWGGRGNDTLYGEDGNDELDGEAGNDSLNGGAGNDVLFGGLGDDTLVGGEGNDILFDVEGSNFFSGGAGTDTLDYTRSNTGLIVDLVNGMVSRVETPDVITDRLISIENVIGSQYSDIIEGAYDNSILRGGAGDDDIRGWNGNDSIFGGADDDILRGDAGNDFLVGDAGSDDLYGGIGADIFGFSASALTDIGSDTIHDLNIDEGDRVDLSQLLGNRTISDLSDHVRLDDLSEEGSYGLYLRQSVDTIFTKISDIFSVDNLTAYVSDIASAFTDGVMFAFGLSVDPDFVAQDLAPSDNVPIPDNPTDGDDNNLASGDTDAIYDHFEFGAIMSDEYDVALMGIGDREALYRSQDEASFYGDAVLMSQDENADAPSVDLGLNQIISMDDDFAALVDSNVGGHNDTAPASFSEAPVADHGFASSADLVFDHFEALQPLSDDI